MASVKKRAGYGFEVRYIDPATGKRPSKTFPLKKDADAFKRKVEREIEDGLHVAVASSSTVESLAAEYMKQRAAMLSDGRLSNNTFRNDEGILRRYVVPAFPNKLVRDIQPAEVDRWLSALSAKQGLAGKTTKEVARTFSHLLDFAVRRQYAAKNVVRDVRGWDEHRKLASEPIRTFAVEDVRALVEWMQPVDNGRNTRGLARPRPGASRRGEAFTRCCVYLAAFCGLRMGEIFGLTVAHLKLDEGVVEVRHSLDQWGSLRPPKTRAGIRDVPVPAMALAELRAWIADHYTANDSGLLFTSRNGAPMRHTTFYRYHWHPALRGAGLMQQDKKGRSFHFHALRHFAASMLIGGGVPLPDVAALLGHRSFDMTLQVYAHPLIAGSRKRSAFEAIAATLTQADASV